MTATGRWVGEANDRQRRLPVARGFCATWRPRSAKVLNETGYAEGQNVMVDHHWLDGQYDRLPSLMADLRPPSRRRDCHTGFTAAAAVAP
jgi:hypothetical protein